MEGSISLNKDKQYVLDGITFASYSAATMAKQLDKEQLKTLPQPISTVTLYVNFGHELVD